MVKLRAVRRVENDMGQTSSQLGPPQIEGQTANMAGTRKKSKSKQSKKKAAVEQLRLEEEQESARALMQLAQGSVEHGRRRYYEEDSQPTAHPETEGSQHQYGPNMTSQEIIALTSQEHSSDERAKRKKKKDKRARIRDEVLETLNDLGVNDSQGARHDRPSKQSRQREQTPTIEMDVNPRQSVQALDDSSTGDEVDNIAKGTQDFVEPVPNGHETVERSRSPPRKSLQQSQEDPAALPAYSASQRLRGISETATKLNLKKRKRPAGVSTDATDATDPTQMWVDQVVDSQPPQQDYQGQYPFSDNFDPFGVDQGQAHPADLDGHPQVPVVPIDPVLHSMNAQSRSERAPAMLHYGPDLAQIRTHGSTKSRKRRRVEALQESANAQGANEEEVPYYSPYASHESRGGPQDHTLLGDDHVQSKNFPELGSPFEMEPMRNGQPESEYIDLTNRQSKEGYRNTESVHQNGVPSNRKSKTENNKDHFGSAEIVRLEAFRDHYCETNNKTPHEFNDIIQSNIRGNPRAVALFKEIQDIFPLHRRSYVQRFCRRKFHNFSARGTWTPAEDEMLRRAVAEKGTAWKTVGEMIERFPEDCRDRYRNYLANAEHRNREQWTEAEVVNLAGAIVDCMRTMKVDRHRQKQEQYGHDVPMSESEGEQDKAVTKLINWQAVSDRMGAYGGGRSRLQCSFKWNKLKPKDQKRYLRDIRESRRGLNGFQVPNDNFTKSGGWRMRQASKKVSNMLPGDRYDLLQAVLQCGAPSEGNIPWKSMGEDWWQARWTTTERKAAWLMLKDDLPGSDGMDYRDVVYRLLTPLLAQGIDERWDPIGYEHHASHANMNPPRPKKKGKGKEKEQGRETVKQRRAAEANMRRQEREIQLGIKSREFVDDEDDNDDDDNGDVTGAYRPPRAARHEASPGFEPNDFNRFDTLMTPVRPRRGARRRSMAAGNGRAGDGGMDNADAGEEGNGDDDNHDVGSAHEHDSLFDERPDPEVSQELAGRVLSLQQLQ